MPKLFVVVSGLPGSGKTTLALQLASALGLPLIDKDDILERLFDQKGTGDPAWRRALSRESDAIFRTQAACSPGAVLVSFWHLPGMAGDSGTPTEWIRHLSGQIVNVHCLCEPEIAAARFTQRTRHQGHLDSGIPCKQRLESIRELANLGPLDVGTRIEVDTSAACDVKEIVDRIRGMFQELLASHPLA